MTARDALADAIDASLERRQALPDCIRGYDYDTDLIPLAGDLLAAGWRPPLAAETDGEADAWYVRVLDEPVHHTTESAPVNLDWTRDGSLIGIELLGPLQREQPDSAEVQWGVRTADGMCIEFERGGETGARRFVNSCEGRATLIRRTVGPWIEVPS